MSVLGAAPAELGFIGLGQMGGPMAWRLLAPDVRLHVHDPDPVAMGHLVSAGAVGHPSPAAVADTAGCIFACLPSAQVSEQVALQPGGIAFGRAVRTYVEMSTIGGAAVRRLADRLAGRGIEMLDAPVSGGPAGARAGTLAIMAAGSTAAMEAAAPWLGRIGRQVFQLGDQPGAAQVMKLVNNLVLASTMAGTFEALVLGIKAGLDAATMVEVLNASTGRSMVTTDILPANVLSGGFDFGAAMSILAKDVALGVADAQALGVPMPVLERAAAVWQSAAAAGLAGADMTRLLPALAAQADVSWPGTLADR